MESLFEPLRHPSLTGILATFPNRNPERPDRKQLRDTQSPKEKKLGNRVLIVGRQRELALYRAEFLRLAGYTVSIPESADEALRIMKRGDFDAIVLSYTLPNETVQWLAESAREFCPDCPIIAITNSSTFDPHIAPDAVALATHGPGALLSALSRVLQAS